MDVRLTSDGAIVSGAEGTVWQEKFTMNEAGNIRFHMERLADDHIPMCHRKAWDQLGDMLAALTNDSDACVITVEPEP